MKLFDEVPPVWLICDLGNSFLKAGLTWGALRERGWEPNRERYPDFEPLLEIEHKGEAKEDTWLRLLGALKGRRVRLDGIALSSVVHPDLCGSLVAALDQPDFPPVQLNPDPGLQLRIRHPETVGLDRLYAARWAFEVADGKAAIVVDAGTALTVDAVVPAEEGWQGVFLGGAIAPGPRMLADALGTGAAQLQAIQPRQGVRALGRDTAEALEAGVVVGFQGAALHLVERISQEAGLEDCPIVLGGGASRFLMSVFENLNRPVLWQPGVVSGGLMMAVREPIRG